MATAAPAKTRLTLRVPADAKITLAGVPTKQTGEVREFATNRLAAGQTWSNYNVHVEVTRDGKTYTQDRTILLTGGQSQELDFRPRRHAARFEELSWRLGRARSCQLSSMPASCVAQTHAN